MTVCVKKLEITAFELAQRYVGVSEIAGQSSSPIVLAMLKLDQNWPGDDSVPWCSAFMNWICWNLRLPRSKSLRARSWLNVGHAMDFDTAKVGFDVIILKRGGGKQPGPDVIDAPGHVGFFAGWRPDAKVLILGGNQSDEVNQTAYKMDRVLGIRRLYS